MTEEGWQPWEVIPEVANRVWQVDVVHLEESLGTSPALRLSLVIAAQWPVAGQEDGQRGAWRVSFSHVQAYRMRPFHYDKRNLPLLIPEDQRAVYEISPSRYLEETVTRSWIDARTGVRIQFHHYVIFTGTDDAYEIVAGAFTCEPLSPAWAYPFGEGPIPRPE